MLNSAAPSVVTFGEVMLRLAAPDGVRLAGARVLDATFGGGEANVAASLAGFGIPARFVTRVPANDLGEGAIRFLRGLGVDTSGITSEAGRLGVYYLEPGAAQRASRVVYDRADSCIAKAGAEAYDWSSLLSGARWFHTTGIAKLWSWGAAPGDVMAGIVAEADVLVGNEEDAEKVFGIRAPGSTVSEGRIDPAGYAAVAAQLAARFPQLRTIAFTQRGSISASENTWSGVIWTPDAFHVAKSYRIAPIMDRVGAGDAFAAGLIYGLLDGRSLQGALEFGVAASCLKHSIRGDVNQVSLAEVDALAGGSGSGRVER